MASYYNQDPEDNNSYKKTVAMCVAAASMVILLFLVILYVNTDRTPVNNQAATAKTEEKEEDDILQDSHNITSDELEFWQDAKKPKTQTQTKEEEGQLTPYKDPKADNANDPDRDSDRVSDKDTDKDRDQNADRDKDPKNDRDSDTDRSSTTSKDGSTDRKRDENDEGEGSLNKKDADDDNGTGDYITVSDEYGNKKRYEIMKNVYKNDYDLQNDLINDNGELKYRDNKRESIKGVDLSKYNGTVDFAKLKESGVGFAMLRLGSRGYGTGAISLDEKFVEYAQNAQLTGIQIGAYFYSQAVNETEAIEEANYIVGAVSGFNIKYPIAIDVERVEGDEARTDKLTNEERTAIVKAFCDAVKGYGYKPIIYASKDMLIAGMNLEDLGDYDVWLQDYDIPTDYPYRFSMWQYDQRGRIDGITGDIDMNISFINYEQK